MTEVQYIQVFKQVVLATVIPWVTQDAELGDLISAFVLSAEAAPPIQMGKRICPAWLTGARPTIVEYPQPRLQIFTDPIELLNSSLIGHGTILQYSNIDLTCADAYLVY